jgi:PTH1 family peptidyl-tRNA hydrolase
VVYDDADLEIGRIRIRERGGAGGHNGMRSLIAALDSEEIPRVRLGVLGRDRESSDLAEYVLRQFDPEEEQAARALVEMGADAVETVVSQGVAIAMNRFNGRLAPEAADDTD